MRYPVAKQETADQILDCVQNSNDPAHLIWLQDYKTWGENSYVYRDKDKLHELYRDYAISMNDESINGAALDYADSIGEAGLALGCVYNINLPESVTTLGTIEDMVLTQESRTVLLDSEVALSALLTSKLFISSMPEEVEAIQQAHDAAVAARIAAEAVINDTTSVEFVNRFETMLDEKSEADEKFDTAMNAVIASETAMSAVAASETAMSAVIASETAMAAVAASETAMKAAVNSNVAMNNEDFVWTLNSMQLPLSSYPSLTKAASATYTFSGSSSSVSERTVAAGCYAMAGTNEWASFDKLLFAETPVLTTTYSLNNYNAGYQVVNNIKTMFGGSTTILYFVTDADYKAIHADNSTVSTTYLYKVT